MAGDVRSGSVAAAILNAGRLASKQGERMNDTMHGMVRTISACVLAAAGCGFVGFMSMLVVQINTVSCVRAEAGSIDCTIATRAWNVLPMREKTVRGLQGATVEDWRPDSETMYSAYIMLATAEGKVPLDEKDGGGMTTLAALEKDAKQIDSFVREASTTTLTMQVGSADWLEPSVWCGMSLLAFGGLGFGLFGLAALGGAFMWSAPTEHVQPMKTGRAHDETAG